jgi:hypothetical protein
MLAFFIICHEFVHSHCLLNHQKSLKKVGKFLKKIKYPGKYLQIVGIFRIPSKAQILKQTKVKKKWKEGGRKEGRKEGRKNLLLPNFHGDHPNFSIP